jgi:hypothetical protein
MAEISVTFNILDESGQVLQVSDHTPISELLPHILRNLSSNTQAMKAMLDQSIILVARPVRDLESTLYELGVRNGDVLHIVQTHIRASSVKLTLTSPQNSVSPFYFEVDHSPALLGVHRDINKSPSTLDIDLSPVLPEDKLRLISRQQAEFTEADGVWSVRLYDGAKAPMFVDNERLIPDRSIQLNDNSVLSFGSNLNRPDFQVIVRLLTE